MFKRVSESLIAAVLLTSLVAIPLLAKDKNKKKQELPDYVLKAQTVRVEIFPGAGEPLDQPMANSMARENVEKALSEWGRYRVVMDGAEADLVFQIRTGNDRMVRPTIQGGPIDQRGGVGQGTDSTVRIGGQTGRPPGSYPSDPMDQSPHISNEIGPSGDMLAVYMRNSDSSPVWRYIAKDALRAPAMKAVEEFRKAVAEAEKPQVPPQKQP